MMRHIALLMTLAVFLAGCGQKQAGREERAVSAIIKLGGGVTRDAKLPGRPVVGVDLRDTKVTDSDLKDLKELRGLQVLDLSDNKITDAGLKNLKELKGLRTLDLINTKITDVGLKDRSTRVPARVSAATGSHGPTFTMPAFRSIVTEPPGRNRAHRSSLRTWV